MLKRIDSVLAPEKQKVIQTSNQMSNRVSDRGLDYLVPRDDSCRQCNDVSRNTVELLHSVVEQ